MYLLQSRHTQSPKHFAGVKHLTDFVQMGPNNDSLSRVIVPATGHALWLENLETDSSCILHVDL